MAPSMKHSADPRRLPGPIFVIINVSKIWAPQTLTDGLSTGRPPGGRGHLFNEKFPRPFDPIGGNSTEFHEGKRVERVEARPSQRGKFEILFMFRVVIHQPAESRCHLHMEGVHFRLLI